MSATRASRVPVRALNSVDLPTFGRPTRATTGSMAYGPQSACGPRCGAPGLDFPGISLHQQQVARRNRRVAHAAASRLAARQELPGRDIEPVQVTLEIADDQRPLREHRRRERARSEEHTSELQSLAYLVCRLL